MGLFILYFIQANIPYIVKFKVTNGAGLAIEEESTPILYDSSKPTAGKVVDGSDFLNDRVWFSSSKTITGKGNIKISDYLSTRESLIFDFNNGTW